MKFMFCNFAFLLFNTSNADDVDDNLVDIESNPSEPDHDVALAAGLAEGYLTGTFINLYYQGTKLVIYVFR